nr:tyrosine-type recombinase/integrase [Burkholderia multivorans]
MALLGRIQLAHFFIVTLSMGARQSESLRLRRDCVVRAPDNRPYANGKTYKLVQRHDGEMRAWLLPDVAVDAIEQQTRLVSFAERLTEVTPNRKPSDSLGNDHLWVQISAAAHADATRPLVNINKALHSYARAIQMSTTPGGQNLRTHRLRKTLARLVALALTQAPKLLMDVFGHKSIEMTLYYILSDKDLQAEIETVSRELRVMRAKTVVEKMVEDDLMSKDVTALSHGGYGGLAAASIHDTITRRRHQVHRRGNKWGAENIIELAELLTLQGKAWEQVRRGVICTKLPGESGPCNKRKGRPEPAKCSSACTHRLEEAFLREDVDAVICEAIAAFEQSVANGEQLIAAHWAAQVRANVPRFPDLSAKWMRNATVAGLMAVVQGEVAG